MARRLPGCPSVMVAAAAGGSVPRSPSSRWLQHVALPFFRLLFISSLGHSCKGKRSPFRVCFTCGAAVYNAARVLVPLLLISF